MRWSSLFLVSAALHAAGGDEFFETRVRPVLSDKCAGCHGEQAASGLRVDSIDALRKGGKRGPAIVPGRPDESLMIAALRHRHESLKMPPAGPLPSAEIEALETWIRNGATWPTARAPERIQKQFWSFGPLRESAGSIDDIARRAQRAKGISPNPPADSRTLLRRLHAGLTGLPPTPAEAEAFLSDSSPRAVELLVDRLLASAHFGERWGRHWLDVARFGEDDFSGTAPQPYPQAWRYRDWVIKAFNDDLPYDAFVRAQIAADLVGTEHTQALGLFGLGPWYYGITQPPQARADERHDRVDMVTRGFLGLTAACARCHDHKYDPIPQTDYYALAGVFASSEYKDYPLATPAEVAAYENAQKRIKSLEKEIADFLSAQRDQLAAIYVNQSAAFLLRKPGLDAEIADKWCNYLSKVEEDHPFLKPWHAASTPDAKAAAAADFQETLRAVIQQKREIDEENRRAVIRGVDPNAKRRKIILPFKYDSDADFNPGADVVTKSLDRERFQLWHKLIGREDAIYRLNDAAVERRLSGEWKRHLDSLRAQLDREKKSAPKPYPYIHGLAEHAEPIDLPLNVRGNPNDLGDPVPRHFLTCISNGTEIPLRAGSGRLQLADAIIAHPLASRVMANRVWAWLFGTGVVRTPSNFGLMGERPANPELLDHLAIRLRAHNYSIKKLIREIVLSETYLASSEASTQAQAIDPDNRLFWRANRRRLDAETIRDAILSASGELNRVVGGESSPLSNDNVRRTVYVRVSRYQQNETLALFDFPATSVHVEQRAVTNVPLQKLFFLNSDFFRYRSEALAQRIECAAENDSARIDAAYKLLFQRDPRPDEKSAAASFLTQGNWTQYAQVLLSTNEFLYVD